MHKLPRKNVSMLFIIKEIEVKIINKRSLVNYQIGNHLKV